MTFVYRKYSQKYKQIFNEFKEQLEKACGTKYDIQHVGSSSVSGLGGKGIIDIQIGISRWSDVDNILPVLKKLGIKHIHPIENHNLFASSKAKSEEGDVHIHICRKGTERYERTLFFRDYLMNHPEEVSKYQSLKQNILEKVQGDRQLYKQLKNKYFDDFYRSV